MSDACASEMRRAFEHMLGQFCERKPDLALFTTFNFSPSFFENNVLPLLAGSTVEELRDAPPARADLNAVLAKIRTVVVCDRSTAPPPKGDLRYGLLPVGLERGRFHAKIIVLAGRLASSRQPGMWITVTSGNLSYAGWAVNREVAGATPVAAEHAAELWPLLQWLHEQAEQQISWVGGSGADTREEGATRQVLGGLLAALRTVVESPARRVGLPSLHVGLPAAIRERMETPGLHVGLPAAFRERPETLLAALVGTERWRTATVVSPFWESVPELLAGLNADNYRFVPALREGRYVFPRDAVAGIKSVEFACFRDGRDRYTHAKTILLERDGETVLAVGSGNFTGAGLGAGGKRGLENIEAMLRYRLADAGPWTRLFDALDADSIGAPDDGEEEGAPPLPPFAADVVCDWHAKTFSCRVALTEKAAVREVELEVAGQCVKFAAVSGAQIEHLPFRGARPVRHFVVTWRNLEKDGTCEFRGLVTQINAKDDQLGYRPPPRLASLLKRLRELDPDAPGHGGNGHGNGGGDGDDETEFEPDFDFFRFFQATYKLRRYYEKRPEQDPFCEFSSLGLPQLFRAVSLQPATTPEAVVGRYVQVAELIDVLDRLAGSFPERRPDELRGDLQQELRDIEPRIIEALHLSPVFASMLGHAIGERDLAAFMRWFRLELKETVNVDA